jgi:hypothetical protein
VECGEDQDCGRLAQSGVSPGSESGFRVRVQSPGSESGFRVRVQSSAFRLLSFGAEEAS